MLGFIFCALAGAAMSVQGVMNTRLGEGIGTMEANTLVQCTAAVLSVLALFVHRTGSFSQLGSVPWYYMLGGVLGLVITVTVMLGIGALSPTVAISVILISQLAVAALIDALGLMGAERVALDWQKGLGLALMVGGVLLFKR
ncbi:MAG TPA: DMT family transporter [Candidatus Scatomorpha merdavium]|jgi:transporter family-2 protein|nr:DMT family transporter [Candidatus Scatomorpha merdavium]